eukprot:7068869-Pyramimonas_sp.AAC.1
MSGGLGEPISPSELRGFSRQLAAQCVVTGAAAKSLAEVKIKNEGAAVALKLARVKAMAAASGKRARGGHQ